MKVAAEKEAEKEPEKEAEKVTVCGEGAAEKVRGRKCSEREMIVSVMLRRSVSRDRV